MELEKAINERRSTRAFTAKELDKSAVEALISQAMMAPSAMNSQPWTFFVIQDAELLKEINRRTKKYLLDTLSERPRQSRYKERFESEEFDIFYGGKALAVICGKPEMPNGEGDCHLAAQNLMLSAWDKGIGSCFLGFVRTYLDTSEGKNWLGLPADYAVVAPLVLGYPAEANIPAPERKPAEILFWK